MKQYSILSKQIKRRSSFYFMAICMLLLGYSCVDDTFESYQRSSGDNVAVKVCITAPIPPVAKTRTVSDAEFNPNGLYLMVFERSAAHVDDNALAQIVKITGSGTSYSAQLAKRGECIVYIVANAEKTINEKKTSWEATSTTLGDVKRALKFTLPTSSRADDASDKVITGMIAPQPMLVEVLLDKIDANTQIGTPESPVLMQRTTVKISVRNETQDNGAARRRQEILLGANLINTPSEGYLFAMDDESLLEISRHQTGAESDLNGLISTPSAGAEEYPTCTLYSFESVSGTQTPTAVVIEATHLGKSYFYRLNLDIQKKDYALVRSFHYIVRINNILQAGFDTMEEAVAEEAPHNVEYTVNVTDDTSADMITDGEYYLGVSNSEFFALADGALQNISITTVNSNYPRAGRIELSGGLTLAGGNSLSASPDKDSPIKTDIAVNLPANFTQGTVTVVYNEALTRTISVYKTPQVQKLGALLKDSGYSKDDYISARVEETYRDWLMLTLKSELNDIVEERDLFARCESEAGGINVRVKANLGDNSSPQFRIGYVNFFRKDNVGNARVLIKQDMFNVYQEVQGKAALQPYTYVGTFHRHNQTAERIIRVDSKIVAGNTYQWRAFVIYGDFIRLSVTDSEDPGINEDDFYGQGDNTTTFGAALEGRYEVKDGKVDVEVRNASRIFFRVGLTSTISTHAIRYGLIGIQVNNNVGTDVIDRYIFVRQGEEADYLMNPHDPIAKDPSFKPIYPGQEQVLMSSRPLAAKISPLNLTDPNGTLHSDLTGRKGVFTTYPSQAGYLYQSISKQGWIADPRKSDEVLSSGRPTGWDKLGNVQYPWIPDYEVCPEGYYHPQNGIDDGTSTDANANVENASIRQSLWLYPANGGVSQTENFIIGYMADGYFDRQPMDLNYQAEFGDRAPKHQQPVLVNEGAGIAYIGTLAFNPHTVASIFMPMAGYYEQVMRIVYAGYGNEGSFSTATRVNGNKGGYGAYFTLDYGFMSSANLALNYPYSLDASRTVGFRVDNYTNHSQTSTANIRCIRK